MFASYGCIPSYGVPPGALASFSTHYISVRSMFHQGGGKVNVSLCFINHNAMEDIRVSGCITTSILKIDTG
jgi:hypothetical protein